MEERGISFSKDSINEHFDFSSGKIKQEIPEKNEGKQEDSSEKTSSETALNMFNSGIYTRMYNYSPNGRIEYVKGHWRIQGTGRRIKDAKMSQISDRFDWVGFYKEMSGKHLTYKNIA